MEITWFYFRKYQIKHETFFFGNIHIGILSMKNQIRFDAVGEGIGLMVNMSICLKLEMFVWGAGLLSNWPGPPSSLAGRGKGRQGRVSLAGTLQPRTQTLDSWLTPAVVRFSNPKPPHSSLNLKINKIWICF